MNLKPLVSMTVLVSALVLSGCAATSTAISHRNLDVTTKMSDSIFLEPVSPSQRSVYVEVRNTSDKPEFNLSPTVKAAIQQKGYTVTNDPTKAHYRLQANVLSIEEMTPEEANHILSAGYGAVLGAGTAALVTHDSSATLAGGILGGIMGTVADAMVKDVNYVVVTDVQLSERTSANVNQNTNSSLKQGSSSVVQQNTKETTHWKQYRTRVVSTADKVNLDFAEAEPVLEKGLSNSLAGLF